VVVQVKHDGSNILKIGSDYFTRNLNPIPPNWKSVIDSMFPEIKNSKYDFYFELGGENNAPAGFTKCWRGAWDYRVLDAYPYRYPLDFLRDEGLKLAEVLREFSDFYAALEYALRELPNWRHCEGLVVKAYGIRADVRELRDGVLFAKVKHDNYKKWFQVLGGAEQEQAAEAPPDEEVRKELHKILSEMIARGIDVSRIGVNEVWKQLEAELGKHGYALAASDRERVRQLLREVKRALKAQSG